MCAPCRQFAEACGQALDVNERLIKEDQLEYQEEMRAHYRNMLSELSGIMNEQVWLPRNQTAMFAYAPKTTSCVFMSGELDHH